MTSILKYLHSIGGGDQLLVANWINLYKSRVFSLNSCFNRIFNLRYPFCQNSVTGGYMGRS